MKSGNRLAIILAITFIHQILIADNFIERLRVPIKLSYSSSFGYDSNIFRLSDLERNQYYKDAHNINIITPDAAFNGTYISPKINIKYIPYLIDWLTTEFKFSFNRNMYISIPEKSYSVINSEFGIKLGSYRWIKFSHRYLPKYYLRNYKDRDYSLNDYHQAIFSSESFRISYSHPINRKIWSRIRYSRTNLYYNDHFTEYDIVNDEIESRLYFKVYKFDNNLSYSFSASNNTLDNINSEASNFDRSYKEHIYGINAKRRIKKLSYIDNFGMSLIVKHRKYVDFWSFYDFNYVEDEFLLDHSVPDVLHHGREDIEYNFSVWARNKISKSFSHEIKFKYRSKDPNSMFKIPYTNGMGTIEEVSIGDLKEFSKFEIIYKIVCNTNLDILY